MFRQRERRTGVLIVMAVVLVLGFVPKTEAAGLAGPLEQFFSWFEVWMGMSPSRSAELLPGDSSQSTRPIASRANSDAGVAVDSNGRSLTSSSTANSDAGPAVDPNGAPH